jgi:hypothetical protein
MLITTLLRYVASQLSPHAHPSSQGAVKALLIGVVNVFRDPVPGGLPFRTYQPVLMVLLGLMISALAFQVGDLSTPHSVDLSGLPLLVVMLMLIAGMAFTLAAALYSLKVGCMLFVLMCFTIGFCLSQTTWPMLPLSPLSSYPPGSTIEVVINVSLLLPARWLLFCYTLMLLQLATRHDGHIRWYERLWLHMLLADVISSYALNASAGAVYLVDAAELQVYTAPFLLMIPTVIHYVLVSHPQPGATGFELWTDIGLQCIILGFEVFFFLLFAQFAANWVNTERMFSVAHHYERGLRAALDGASWRMGILVGISATFIPLLALFEGAMWLAYGLAVTILERLVYGSKHRRP